MWQSAGKPGKLGEIFNSGKPGKTQGILNLLRKFLCDRGH